MLLHKLDTFCAVLLPINFIREESKPPKVKPTLTKDAVEARFAVQASALFSHGMSNLRKAETADMMCHADHYSNKAIKLLRLHNEQRRDAIP